MKLSYDAEYNVAYLQFQEKKSEVTTIKISDDVNIDIGPDGKLYGIELLNANKQLSEDQGTFIVDAAGKHREIVLTEE